MLRGRRAAIAAAMTIAVAATVTAGCGGGGSSSQGLALDPVAAAATKTQDAGAARIRFALALTTPQTQGKTIRLRGLGAIDGTSSELSFKLASMLGRLKIPAEARAKLTHASLKTVSLEENGDYVVYLRLGFLASQLPGGKQWIKLDLSKLGKKAGVDLGSLLSGSQFQPGDLLAMLEAEGAHVDKVGTATVDGVQTTHYRVAVDLAKALRTKGLTSPLLGRIAGRIKSTSNDVWVGKDGLVHRIRTAYSGSTPSGAQHMAMTIRIYDYGAHVTIAAPPNSAVFDATQLAQSGLSSSLP